jgi:signal transduction histidine kinase
LGLPLTARTIWLCWSTKSARFCRRNLIGNSSKYTPIGGLIGFTLSPAATDVVLAVKGTGKGIALAGARSLFESFVLAPEALVTGFSGLGIGLAVARELIAAHDGSADVHSESEDRVLR